MAGWRRVTRWDGLLIACLTAFTVTLLPAALKADENLPAKRQMCQTEARERIKPRGRANGSLYEMVVRKRHEYVQTCMARAPDEPKTKTPAQPTGATARNTQHLTQ